MKIAIWSFFAIFAAAITILVILPPIITLKSKRELEHTINSHLDSSPGWYAYGSVIHISHTSLTIYPRFISLALAIFGLTAIGIALYLSFHVPKF